MNEHEQREQPVADGVCAQIVAYQRRGEHGQPIEPFGGGGRGELRQMVPSQPNADDARDIDEPQQRYSGEPGKVAKAGVPPEQEFAQQMQQRDQEEGVGGVAVQAAQHAAEVPLLAREPVYGAINARDRGVENGVKIQSSDGDNPEEQETECPEMAPRVERSAEYHIETVLDAMVGDQSAEKREVKKI